MLFSSVMNEMKLLNGVIMVHIYLKVCFHQSCEGMVFLAHPAVTDFYMKLRLDYNGTDPFIKYNRYQRKDLCNLLLTANLYTFPGPLTGTRDSDQASRVARNYQEVGYNSGMSEAALRYNDMWMETGSENVPIKAFPCVLDGISIVLLTYGFESYLTRMFVLTMTRRNDTTVIPSHMIKMIAVLESNPLFHGDFASRHYVNDYFQQSIARTGKDQASTSGSTIRPELSLSIGSQAADDADDAPAEPNLRLSSEFQHFRLCCSVGDELRNDPRFELDIKTYNFVYPMTNVREHVRAILDPEDEFVAYANVIPCSINFQWSRPKFYLLRSSYIGSTSVFVFKPMKNETYGESLKLEGIAEHILPLRDM